MKWNWNETAAQILAEGVERLQQAQVYEPTSVDVEDALALLANFSLLGPCLGAGYCSGCSRYRVTDLPTDE